jgi:hypothetical protein
LAYNWNYGVAMAGFDRQEQQTTTADHDQAPPAQVEDSGQAGKSTQFTNAGPIPPVNTAPPQPAGPSASDRAYGPHESGASSHTFSGPAHLRVTADGLNVRSSPDASGRDNIVGGVHHGDELEADGRDGDWVCISFKGQRAFVHGRYVEAIPAKVAPEVAAQPEKVIEAAKEAEKPAIADTATTPAAPSPVPMPLPNLAKHEETEAPKAAKHIEPKPPAAPVEAHEQAAPATPTATTAAPKHADPAVIRAEYQMLVATARTGFMPTSTAVEQLIQFDRQQNGGEMSPTGLELLATMPFEIAQQHVDKIDEKIPVKPGPSSVPAPVEAAPAAGTVAPVASHGEEHGTDAKASAGGPAGVWTPPADAHLTDTGLAQLGAQLNDPKAEQILADLAGVEAVAAKMKPHLFRKVEATGVERENLVAGIHAIRAGLQGMASGDKRVEAFKVAVNRKIEALSPYYSQININTIESKGGLSTCNVTSLAMSLSTIGKNADAYKESKRSQIVAVARHFGKDVQSAERATAGHAAAFASLRGLRLPDFMELAAVATNLHTAEPSDAEIATAAQFAVDNKTSLTFLAQIAQDFGANTQLSSHTIGAAATKNLKDIGGKHHFETDHLVDLRNKAEANPNDAEAQKAYEDMKATVDPHINNAAIEKQLSLDTYKSGVMAVIKPLLDSGAGVVASTYNHFTHCYEMTEEHIRVQDPGQWTRADRKINWDEARALEYFWNYLVVR